MAWGDMTKQDEVKRAEAAKLTSIYRMMGAEERAKPDQSRGGWRPSFSLLPIAWPKIRIPGTKRAAPSSVRRAPATREVDLTIAPSRPQAAAKAPPVAPRPVPAIAIPPVAPPPVARPTVAAAPPRPRAAAASVASPSPRRLKQPRIGFKLPRVSLPKVAVDGRTTGVIAAMCALVLGGAGVALSWRSAPVETGRSGGDAGVPALVRAPPATEATPAPAPAASTAVASADSEPDIGDTATPAPAIALPTVAPTIVASVPVRPGPRRLAPSTTTSVAARRAAKTVDRRAEAPVVASRAVPAVNAAKVSPTPRETPSIRVDLAQLAAADTKPVYTESNDAVQPDQKLARRAQRDAASDAIRTLRLR